MGRCRWCVWLAAVVTDGFDQRSSGAVVVAGINVVGDGVELVLDGVEAVGNGFDCADEAIGLFVGHGRRVIRRGGLRSREGRRRGVPLHVGNDREGVIEVEPCPPHRFEGWLEGVVEGW